ncbi:GTPase associated putative protein/domain-like protein [Desulfofarcimen acetoxidans DSM 771]|uniref:GTPase domain-containing protein n=1 Tax=Desulfofarcimen acetoxidans (strain ATCC 49208 / DSM 771 / KCTC 5769 / VKM B-1644 / 5575) TaxID=485916 RepID=C8W3F2_DESAS|nr:DUF697 domain-containing protein [Desulfofarcimen acetoxidans]ACV63738.1 GTPase associated putative protein/domain-like protein [Desulfofarcimen acetoxidans DSM 771]
MSKFEEVKEKLAREYAQLESSSCSEHESVDKIIMVTSALCAGIAVQPLPFADIAILTPLQAFMAMKIGKIKGFELSTWRSKEIIVELGGLTGMGFLAQQATISLYKLGLPFAGGFFTLPIAFAFTYAMGRVVSYYFDVRRAGEPLDRDIVCKIWNAALQEGKKLGKKR